MTTAAGRGHGARGIEGARVLLVDAQPIFREALAMLVEHSGLEVAGQVSTGAEAIAEAVRVRPDLVVMDIHLPDLPGHEVCRTIVQEVDGVAVVILTRDADEQSIRLTIDAGARSYILKQTDFAGLRFALEQTIRGGSVLDPRIAGGLLRSLAAERSPSETRLSERELRLLELVAAGMTNQEIAVRLCLSRHTVKEYLGNVMRKLGVGTRVEAVLAAERRGLLNGAPPATSRWE